MNDALILRSRNERLALTIPVRGVIAACGLLILVLLIAMISLMSGSYPLSPAEVWQTLMGRPPEPTAATVVWQFRFPRLLTSVLVGALLALSGALLQNVTLNPLADPALVGVSQGASLAVVAIIVAFPQADGPLRPLYAFGGALVVAALIQWIAMKRAGGATMRFILTGIGIAAFISAMTSALLTYGQVNQAMSALGWLSGSIHAAGWGEVRSLSVLSLLMIPALIWAVGPMRALRFGADMATGLGVAVRPARIVLITLAVALAAIAVAAVGPLGFVGLIAPHLARRLVQTGLGLHLVLTALVGAAMVSGADLIGRAMFAPLQIPAGIVTALVGVPIFVVILLRSQARSQL